MKRKNNNEIFIIIILISRAGLLLQPGYKAYQFFAFCNLIVHNSVASDWVELLCFLVSLIYVCWVRT